jgi:pantothenate kinase
MKSITIEESIKHLIALNQKLTKRYIIALAGIPGSGKTTLSQHLENEVNSICFKKTIQALSMDGFHYTKAELNTFPDPEEAFSRRGAPWTFNTEKLSIFIHKLHDGYKQRSVSWPAFDHAKGDPEDEAIEITSDTRIIIIEGLYLLFNHGNWTKINSQLNERWFLTTPRNLAMQRLLKRHMNSWNMTAEEAQKRINTNDSLNAELVLQSKRYADLTIQSQ